jgi:hypothetical protein
MKGAARPKRAFVVVVPNGGLHSHGSTGARVDGELQALQKSIAWWAQWLHTQTSRRERGLCSSADAETAAESGRGADAPDRDETRRKGGDGGSEVRLLAVGSSGDAQGEKDGRGREGWANKRYSSR